MTPATPPAAPPPAAPRRVPLPLALGVVAATLAVALLVRGWLAPGPLVVPALAPTSEAVLAGARAATPFRLLAGVIGATPSAADLAALRSRGFDGVDTGPEAGRADLELAHAGCPTDPGAPVPAFGAPLQAAGRAMAARAGEAVRFVLPGIAPTAPGGRTGPDDAEYKVAACGALALGAASLVTPVALADAARSPGTWAALAMVNADLGELRRLGVLGTPTGGARASQADVRVEALRSPDALVVPVVNLRGMHAVDAERCRREVDPHWLLADLRTDVTVTVPPDLGLGALAEVVDGRLRPVRHDVTTAGREVTLRDVELTGEHPCRLFVLARDQRVLTPPGDEGGTP